MNCKGGIALDSTSSFERSIAFRLPPELLAAIFLECAQLCRYDGSCGRQVPRWVAISYVCQYWRNVALDCSHLWACLFFVSPEWIDEQLRRSKTVPLIVHIHDSWTLHDPGFLRSLEKVLDNANHIQDLWIGWPSQDMIDVINARLNAAAPLLQSLYLSAMYCPSDCHFIIPEDMFPGATSLRKMHLEMCDVDWSFRIFNGLTELTLRYTLNRSRENWEGILHILRQSPHLRRLCLSQVLPSASITAPSIDSVNMANPISLPRLKELTLFDPITWVMPLLVQLELPRSAIVRPDCIFDDSHDISMLLSRIPDRFGHPSSPPVSQSAESAQTELRYLDLYYYDETWKLAYGTSGPTDSSSSDILLLREIDLGSQFVSTRVDHGLDSDDFLQWFRVFPLAHVNVLALHSYWTRDIDDEFMWAEVFQDASELRIIGMQYGCVGDLIHALQPRDGMIPVPTLTDIWFSEVEFKRGECSGGENCYGEEYLQCLRSTLASRAQAGTVLQRLVLTCCESITEDDVMELSMLVGRVEGNLFRGGQWSTIVNTVAETSS